MTAKLSFYAFFVWILAVFFFFYEYFIRIVPATISSNIINDMRISPSEFALLGSAYYITYSLMQIPVGILYDRYGVRLFLTLACAICTLGVFGFAVAENFLSAFISRLLIGFGSSFGFISLLILALNWFPQRYFAFLAGLGQMLGAVGPMLAGAPVAMLMVLLNNNWRLLFTGISVFGIGLCVMIALFVRTKPKENREEVIYIKKETPLSKRLHQLLRIPQVWLTMLYAGSIYVSLPLLGAYWGTLYLLTRGFERPSAALMVSMIWIGLAIGSPLIGRLSDHFHRRKPFLLIASLLGLASSLAILYLPLGHSQVALSVLFIILGMAASGQSLSFATIADNVPEDLRATAIGANNSAITLFAAIFPPLVTWVMQKGIVAHGQYLASDFQVAFLLMPIAFGAAFLIALFGIQETFCRSQQTIHYLG